MRGKISQFTPLPFNSYLSLAEEVVEILYHLYSLPFTNCIIFVHSFSNENKFRDPD